MTSFTALHFNPFTRFWRRGILLVYNNNKKMSQDDSSFVKLSVFGNVCIILF